VIAFNNRYSSQACTVRDLSDTGARLRVAQGQVVPDHFDLLIDIDGFEAPCLAIWRRGNDIGVRFEAAPTRSQPRRAQVITAIVPERQPSLRRKPG
jgi:hypothetical protein